MNGFKKLPAVFYRTCSGREVLLHGFIKKTQKTPAKEIDVAVSRMKGGA